MSSHDAPSPLDAALAIAARMRARPALLPHGEFVMRLPTDEAIRATHAARADALAIDNPELDGERCSLIAGQEALDHVQARAAALQAAMRAAQPQRPAAPARRAPKVVQRPTGDELSPGRRLDLALACLARVDESAEARWRTRATRLVETTEESLRDSTRRRLELR